MVEEAAASLVRTAFSRVVTEAFDFSVGLFDQDGVMISQSLGIPGFLGCLALSMKHFLRSYPPDSLRDGDSLMSNDPWIGTGQINDITFVTPIFNRGEIIGYASNVSHSADAGGRLLSGDSREVFEEGLRIPVSKAFSRYEPNEQLFQIIRQNVRVPEMVMGDIYAQLSSNTVLKKRLLSFVKENRMKDIESLSREIVKRSRGSMEEGISRIPIGNYASTVEADGFDQPVRIETRISIKRRTIAVDFSGSSPQSEMGINCCYNYTFAETVFALACVLRPSTPLNEASFIPITVTAPEGSILNPRFPAALGARAMTSQFLQAAVFRALSPAVPKEIIADSSAPIWLPTIMGNFRGRRFVEMLFFNGGMGARPDRDGLNTIGFPANLSWVPVEVFENEKPFIVLKKELRADSAGAGQYRGGFGQHFTMRSLSSEPVTFALRADRINHPPLGLFGGSSAASGKAILNGVTEMHSKTTYHISEGDIIELLTPGGAGYGSPLDREPDRVLKDVQDGLVSLENAVRIYGVCFAPEKEVNVQRTSEERRRLRASNIADQALHGVGGG
jgi:N-methylhydantoinase B